MDETIDELRSQRDALKWKLNLQSRPGLRPAAVALVALGVALLIAWRLTYSDTATSMLLLLTGVTAVCLAVLLYFLSPSRYLAAEVADALALSGVANTTKVLASLMVEYQGIYLPAAQTGVTKVYIPVSGRFDPGMLRDAGGAFVAPDGGAAGGILLEPPGYALLAYARRIGATFTGEGLEGEIRDALENGLELARNVAVAREGDEIRVSMRDLANAGLCAAVRKERLATCTQLGCPVCSFTACMIAECTGRMVTIERAETDRGKLDVTFRLLEGR